MRSCALSKALFINITILKKYNPPPNTYSEIATILRNGLFKLNKQIDKTLNATPTNSEYFCLLTLCKVKPKNNEEIARRILAVVVIEYACFKGIPSEFNM